MADVRGKGGLYSGACLRGAEREAFSMKYETRLEMLKLSDIVAAL